MFGTRVAFLSGGVITGVWYFVLGSFLRTLSGASYQQVLMREAFAGERVHRLLHGDPVSVPPDLSVQGFVDEVVYRHLHKLYPVMDQGRVKDLLDFFALKMDLERPAAGR